MNNENKIRVSLDELAPLILGRLEQGNSIEIIVTGNSMFPLFKHERDCVRLVPVEKLKKKQICFYKRDSGQYILHRIVKIKGDEIYCAGDNQTIIEGPLRRDQFIATVSHYIRKGKTRSVNCLWHRIYSLIWCAIIPYRVKMIGFLIKIKGRKKREKK